MLLGISALSGCAWFTNKQRELAFRPTPGRPADFVGLRPGDVTRAVPVPGTDDEVQIWWLPHANPDAPTVLYLHGTFRNLYRNLPKIDAFREAGFSVVAVDYRGWGESTRIIPSESSIYADAEVAWAELVKRQPVPGKRLIYGHSMGGGVAVEMASRRKGKTDYGGLIVESTFSRWPDVAAIIGFWGSVLSWFAADNFDSVDKIGKVDAPVMIIHGEADDTVPVVLGERLRDAAPAGTRWVAIPKGSHSRLFSDDPATYQAALREMRDKLTP
ncbi:MAG: hypothetical protein RLZZ618_1788 [Pseudomonadota bacterium]